MGDQLQRAQRGIRSPIMGALRSNNPDRQALPPHQSDTTNLVRGESKQPQCDIEAHLFLPQRNLTHHHRVRRAGAVTHDQRALARRILRPTLHQRLAVWANDRYFPPQRV